MKVENNKTKCDPKVSRLKPKVLKFQIKWRSLQKNKKRNNV